MISYRTIVQIDNMQLLCTIKAWCSLFKHNAAKYTVVMETCKSKDYIRKPKTGRDIKSTLRHDGR